jgi:hypothetical protein
VLRWRLPRTNDGQAGLELRLSPTGRTAVRAILRGEQRDRTIPIRARGQWLSADGLRHLDIPGILSISLRPEALGVRVLYARTDLVATLGLPGGRYEFESAELIPG